MGNGYDGYSLSDIAAVTGRNNNNGGFGDSNSGWWIILLLLALGGFGGYGFGGFGGMGGFGGAMGADFIMYPWLSNGQKEIMQNTNQGFDTLHLSNQIEGVRDGIYGLSNQLCNCCADMNQTVSNGFFNAEISANNRQTANMQQAFNNQVTTLQGFNGVSNQIAGASADNRLGIADLKYTVATENCADRSALQEGIRDVIASNTANTQAILNKLSQQELEAKNEVIANLRTQLNMADLKASQVAQNAFITQGFANEVDALYNRLNNCPVPSTPVYGRTPIFTCNNNGCGCGCGNNNLF